MFEALHAAGGGNPWEEQQMETTEGQAAEEEAAPRELADGQEELEQPLGAQTAADAMEAEEGGDDAQDLVLEPSQPEPAPITVSLPVMPVRTQPTRRTKPAPNSLKEPPKMKPAKRAAAASSSKAAAGKGSSQPKSSFGKKKPQSSKALSQQAPSTSKAAAAAAGKAKPRSLRTLRSQQQDKRTPLNDRTASADNRNVDTPSPVF